jgi:hypothetical protein
MNSSHDLAEEPSELECAFHRGQWDYAAELLTTVGGFFAKRTLPHPTDWKRLEPELNRLGWMLVDDEQGHYHVEAMG